MVAFNFKARFVPPIEAKTKTQTIRAMRKDGRMPDPGDTLQLYTGLRTKKTRLIGTAKALVVCPISIDWTHSWVDIAEGRQTRRLDCWATIELDTFARADGFPDWAAFWDFFTQTHRQEDEPFRGFLTKWGDTFEPAATHA